MLHNLTYENFKSILLKYFIQSLKSAIDRKLTEPEKLTCARNAIVRSKKHQNSVSIAAAPVSMKRPNYEQVRRLGRVNNAFGNEK